MHHNANPRRTSRKVGGATIAFVACLAPHVSIASPDQWRALDSVPGALAPDKAYTLQNLANQEVLVYGSQRFGINLRNVRIPANDSTGPRNIVFQREAQSTGPLHYGERIAIRITRGKNPGEFVYYTQRDAGPNLGWSKKPVFEWELRGGNCGEPARTHSPIRLYSSVEKDYLVYCKRPLGVNLRWLKDKESKGCHGLVRAATAEAAKRATEAGCLAYGGEGGAAACRAAGAGGKVGRTITGGGSSDQSASVRSQCY